MNPDKFSESFIRGVHASMQGPLKNLVSGFPEMKLKGDAEMDNFLIYLSKKCGKILSYINNVERKKPLIVEAKTGIFFFSYTIFEDGTSRCDITMSLKTERDFDKKFILSRIKEVYGYVYILKSDFGYKIGCTGDLKQRVYYFGVKLPFDVTLHSYIKTKGHSNLEGRLHSLMKHKRIDGEWFDLSESDFIDLDRYLKNIYKERVLFSGQEII